MESWKYRVEPYRASGLGTWSQAAEANADTWFLFGDRGDDKRVFGVFSSRLGADDAASKLADGRMGKEYQGRYQQMLAEASAPIRHEKNNGIDR